MISISPRPADHVHVLEAGERCSLLGDGLAEFTAGSGASDTLMLCGALSASYPGSSGLIELLCPRSAADTVADEVLESVFEAMRSEIAGAGIGTQAMCQALMKQGLIALLRGARIAVDGDRMMEGVGHHPRLTRALTAILADPAAAHTVDGLASLSGMSRASFSDHFSRAFGRGPIEFVQGARLRVGARLLRTTDLPVKVIARTVGYAGPRPFARAFQGVYGHRPTEHRALAEGGELEQAADADHVSGV